MKDRQEREPATVKKSKNGKRNFYTCYILKGPGVSTFKSFKSRYRKKIIVLRFARVRLILDEVFLSTTHLITGPKKSKSPKPHTATQKPEGINQ